jgi:hypothetical protein
MKLCGIRWGTGRCMHYPPQYELSLEVDVRRFGRRKVGCDDELGDRYGPKVSAEVRAAGREVLVGGCRPPYRATHVLEERLKPAPLSKYDTLPLLGNVTLKLTARFSPGAEPCNGAPPLKYHLHPVCDHFHSQVCKRHGLGWKRAPVESRPPKRKAPTQSQAGMRQGDREVAVKVCISYKQSIRAMDNLRMRIPEFASRGGQTRSQGRSSRLPLSAANNTERHKVTSPLTTLACSP